MKNEPIITPEVVAEHGLKPDEYKRVQEVLGRDPNYTELGIFSVMWSEHCSYKSSKVYLKTLPTEGPQVLQGPGENAGVVDIGDGQAACFKMESHNHPSFIEPYQGAATGVGGILRDIFTMGARPIANMNSLRFGKASHPRTPYLVRGVVAGIGGYGNTMGIPTVGGEVAFDECYDGNILVNAFTLGIMDSEKIFLGKASGVGNPVIYVGSKTGRDGIHGATMASDVFGEGQEERRPTVQVGDPFTEKLLLEACLELMKTDAIVGIQDMGAAGLTCSSFEMADRAGSGMDLDLDRVPQREEGMSAYELMLSESQERMLIVAKQGRESDVREIFEKWGLDVAVIGKVTDSGHVRIHHGGKIVAEIPVAPIVHQAPLYERPVQEPPWQKEVQKLDPASVPVPSDMNEVLAKLIASPNLCCRKWVWEQYDHMVRTNSVVIPGSDAAVVRIKGTKKAIAISTDCNSRYCYLDPYMGTVLAVAESARNLSCAGAVPLAITNCLNFGNPENPHIMWQFRQAIAGLTDACKQFGTPITGGNVSFYNETKEQAIYPTPTIGMVGLIDDVDRHCTQWWKDDGDIIILLGRNTDDLGGSEYLKAIHDRVAGRTPLLDFDKEKAVQNACRTGIRRGLVKSAHDISEGGLAVALAESSISRPDGMIGAKVQIEGDMRIDALLFGEAASRIVLSVDPSNADQVISIARELGAAAVKIGVVGGAKLEINDCISSDLGSLYQAWCATIPAIVGEKI
ncbi:MAG TPA: phosphoribosylformylglycinamidine synthase subunit PurL [bacterium]|nr:phosphoribosylformylglycinamidine synthase subunit PurL [Myxococcales bacterium]OQA61819.1 MAG: Phosphoribosylformylglycinamidine synthase 2 [bacterium ADurb.Bin270]HPW45344.1 phosphoribosylformylglycinamidine synthase subunit PurL [bacterium]